MAEAQGLSRTVLQAPDIIGEQQQRSLAQEQMAMRQASLAEKSKPKPFKLDAKDKLGQLPPEFNTVDEKMSKAVRDYVSKNANELAAGNPEYLSKLQSFIDKYNIFKSQASQASEEFNRDVKGLPDNQRSEYGFAGWLSDVEDLGRNLDISDDLTIGYNTPDGTIDISDAQVVLNPRSYYFKPTNWLEDATRGARATRQSIESGDRTVTKADLAKIRSQIENNINLNLKDSGDALANMINDYSLEELGTQLSPNAIQNIISGAGVQASVVDGGTKLITLDDVTRWAKDKAVEQVGAKADYVVREDDKSGRGGFVDFKDSKGRPVVDKSPTGPTQESVVFSPRSNVKITANIETEEGSKLFEGRVKNVFRSPDGTYSVNWYDRYGDQYIKLNPSSIAELEDALKIPEGSMDQWYDFKMSTKEQGSQPSKKAGEQKTEPKEVTYIFNGEEYTLSELKDNYGQDFDPSLYEGFQLKSN